MPSYIIDLVILITIGYLGWLGTDRGIFEMAAIGLQLLVSLVLAVLLLEPAADLIGGGLEAAVAPFLPQDFPYQAWGTFLAFTLLLWVAFLALWMNLHPRLMAGGDMKSLPIIEKIGGALIGGLTGVLLLGCGLVTLSMIPFLQGLKVNADRLYFDVGRSALRTAGGFTGDWHNGRSLVLDGEPPSRESVPSAKLSSEPRFDLDEDGNPSDADVYRDVDDNGTFTKDLYYEDLDNSSSRRVGLIEKYVVGRWDSYLEVNDRDRPKPAVATKQPPTPPPQASPAPAKPTPAAEPPKPADLAAADEEDEEEVEEIVVMVDENGEIVSEEEMAEGDVEIVEEVVEEDGKAATKK
jgi:uncharacterized membrane protein required for colicin V production